MKLEPAVDASNGSPISVRKKREQSLPAPSLLREMWAVKLEPAVVRYSAAIAAREECQQRRGGQR